MNRLARQWLAALGLLLAVAACTPRSPHPREVAPRILDIFGPCRNAELEVSAMQWHGDVLILVPETLGLTVGEDKRIIPGPQYVYGVHKRDIIAQIDGTPGALSPFPIPVSPSIVDIPGIDGFEALAFRGHTAFLQVETYNNEDGTNPSVILRGTLAPDHSELILDLDAMRLYPRQTRDANISHEALFVHGDEVFSIYELNSPLFVAKPAAKRFGLDLVPHGEIPFPNLDYRITDVTAVQDDGRFWAMNFRYPGGGRESIDPAEEPLATRYGRGESHMRFDQVERIVELRIDKAGVKLVDAPPIQLQLAGDWREGGARNWEGIVRLDDRGFLVVTDKWPKPYTVFAFVPDPAR